MLNISKDGKVLKVTETAFKEYYKDFGWVPKATENVAKEPAEDTNEEAVEENPIEENPIEENDDWNDIEEEEVEKPISNMSKDELIAYANEHGINIDGINRTSQIREAILAAM